MSAATIRPQEIRRVLVRCPNWLGDTVMALPTIRTLVGLCPRAELIAVGPWIEPLLAAEPGVTRRAPVPSTFAARLRQALALRREAIDLAVLLTNSFETALLARVSGARWRLGYQGDGRRPLLTHPLPLPDAPRHQVDRYLGLLVPLGCPPGSEPPPPTLSPSAHHRAEARRLLAEVGVGPGIVAVGLHLGAAFGPSKLWPIERLADLALQLGAAGMTAVFLGRPDAGPLLASVRHRMAKTGPAALKSLVGRDTPDLLPALLAELSALVAPDSGPAHVAAAVGVPVVALFGPTDPRLTAPRGRAVTAIWRRPSCAPCFQPRCPIDHRCLTAVGVDEVTEAVLRLVGS